MTMLYKIYNLETRYDRLFVRIYQSLLVMCLIVLTGSKIFYPTLLLTGLFMTACVIGSNSHCRWSGQDKFRIISVFTLWIISSAVMSGFIYRIIEAISSFLEYIYILHAKGVLGIVSVYVGIVILVGVVSGFLISSFTNQNTRVLKYLNSTDLPLMLLSIYFIADNIIHYELNNLSIIVLQFLFLAISVTISLYNRRRLTIRGEYSRSHNILLSIEFSLYLSNLLLSIAYKYVFNIIN